MSRMLWDKFLRHARWFHGVLYNRWPLPPTLIRPSCGQKCVYYIRISASWGLVVIIIIINRNAVKLLQNLCVMNGSLEWIYWSERRQELTTDNKRTTSSLLWINWRSCSRGYSSQAVHMTRDARCSFRVNCFVRC